MEFFCGCILFSEAASKNINLKFKKMERIVNYRLGNRFQTIRLLIGLVFGVLSCTVSSQTSENNDDKSLSPYFFVQSNDSQADQLPLKSTKAEVNIAGIIADVTVKQEYKNEGKKPIEAIYVFPASTRAAVYSMTMTIGERVIKAVIKEREQARKDYEQARQQGKSASLLEQQRPNVFQMNVANIMPGDLIKVEMKYTELLVPENGVYEFVYPTVVGPRYSNQQAASAPENDKWVANPYTKEGENPMYTFDIKVNLNAGMPVKDARCNTHDLDIRYIGADKVSATLKPDNEFSGNRDFIFQYRLQGDAVHSGLLLYKGETENFFLAMLQPPQRVVPASIPPRDYVFIVDVSGSMSGFPLDISKKLLRDLIGKLRPTDRFNVILFAGASNLFSPQSVPANEANINRAIQFIDREEGGGGTELLPALQRALSLQGTEDFSRTFVILTDGYVDVEKDAFDLVRKNLGKANFFAFGIGSSVNRFLIEGLAHAGAGEPFVVEKPDKASEMAAKFRKYIESPVLTDISIAYQGFQTYDVEPLAIPDVFAERPVVIYGKWKGSVRGKIKLTGKSGNAVYNEELIVDSHRLSAENSALKYLWARKRIQMLDDYSNAGGADQKLKEEITGLGLKYNLLTAYTSFVAIDSEVRNKSGQVKSVQQPLPLPEGVSNNVIGGNSGSYSNRSVKSTAPVITEDFAQSVSYDKVDKFKSPAAQKPKKEGESGEVFTCTEQMPEYPGGQQAMNLFIKQNLQYPKKAVEMGVSGRVYVQFIIDENGVISDIKVLRGIGGGCDEEAIRIIGKMGKWKPGMQNGKAVKTIFTIPIVFSLKG
jgi:Ca-activated chloride channel family protein